ncbi:hypothetical protein L917_02241, partial [Phytophthora nicotianae]
HIFNNGHEEMVSLSKDLSGGYCIPDGTYTGML